MKRMNTIGLAALAAMALTAFLGASSASATTLEVTTVTKNESVTYTLSLAPGTSVEPRNTSGSVENTCTSSDWHGSTSTTTGSKVTGPLSTLSYTNCTRTVTVHNPGRLYVEHISGTTNGTVYSEEKETTLGAPLVGYLTCKTGLGTHLGTLTGVGHGQATLHVSAILDCGLSLVIEATYTFTSPDGLGVSA